MYWFQVWPICGVTCISSNVGHQVALLALFVNVANSWCSLHNQVAPLELVTNIATRWCIGSATRWRYFYYLQVFHQVAPLALPLPTYVLLPSSVGIELLSSSVGVKSVKSAKCRETWTHRTDQGYLDPIMTKQCAPWWVDDKVISRCSTTSSTSQDRLGRVARAAREDFGHLEHFFLPNISLGRRK